MQEAHESAKRLERATRDMLQSYEEVSSKMRRLETGAGLILHSASIIEEESGRPDLEAEGSDATEEIRERIVRFTFEQDLETSRVYRRTHPLERNSMATATSSALYSTAMSMISKASISQISSLSVYALPIYSADLSNNQFYLFGGNPDLDDPSGNEESAQVLTEGLHPPATNNKPTLKTAILRQRLDGVQASLDDVPKVRATKITENTQ